MVESKGRNTSEDTPGSIMCLMFSTITQDLSLTLPNDNIFDSSKFKACADDKIILSKKLKFMLGPVANIVGKGENAGYQHFLLFPQCFQKLFFQEVSKVGIIWEMVNVSSLRCLVRAQTHTPAWPQTGHLTLNLTCQFWALPIQQQIKI